MRDLSKVTYVDGCSYCDVCGYCLIESTDECSSNCPTKTKRAAARAEPLKPKVSLDDIEAAFERNKEGL